MTGPKKKSRQQEFFAILEEFFERSTGRKAENFATFDSFATSVRRSAGVLKENAPDAFRFIGDALPKFYDSYKPQALEEARNAAGIKFVLGGSSRFNGGHFDAVRKTLLYVDTVLIPDPMLPWMETARDEERFRHVLFLETAFSLLHLKPLIDADLPYPAVIVFPSYEKSLENQDPRTQEFLNRFLVDVFSSKLGATFDDPVEVGDFATEKPEEFLRVVEARGMFVAPFCHPDQPLIEQVAAYRNTIAEWRSEEEQERTALLSDSQLVLQGLLERLVPQYHLLENAEELSSNPMLSMESHWHYYSMCAQASEERLKNLGLLDPVTMTSVRAINQPDLNWLGNVPIEDLARLRTDNVNAQFRKELQTLTSSLHESVVGDLDRVAREISKGIAALLADHNKHLREEAEEFQRKYKLQAIGACLTVAATFMPVLAPLVASATAAAIGLTYAGTKLDEHAKKRQQSKSLLGVLATSRSVDED
jgi:hypothetical protein